MIKRVRQEDLKKLAVQGQVKRKGPVPQKAKPKQEPKPVDHSAILSKMAGMLHANAQQQQAVLESMKSLMEREPTSAWAIEALITALQGIHPAPAPTPPKPWSQLRFEIERDGTGTMRAVNVTREAPKRLNS